MSQVSKQRLNLSDIDNVTITFNSQGQIVAGGSPGSGFVKTLSGDANTLVPPTAGGNIQILGGIGLEVIEDIPNNRLILNATSGAFQWNNVLVPAQAMLAENGYLANSVVPVVFSLPTVSNFGDEVQIAGFGIGGWQIIQAAGQQIIMGNQQTTFGAGGSISSNNQFDAIELLCVVPNFTWLLLDSQGNLTIT